MPIHILLLTSTLLIGFVSFAQSIRLPPPASSAVDFRTQVQPILEMKCYGCHGSKQQQSGLRLDRRQAALRGGDYGRVIVPGKSAESKIILRLVGADSGMQMPPAGPLPEEEIGILRAWIDQGAEFPDVRMDVRNTTKPVEPRLACLLEEIRQDNIENAEKIIREHPELVNAQDVLGATPLMYAALNGSERMMMTLLDNGADVQLKSKRGATALHWAILDTAKVRLLLRRSIDVNAVTRDGRSALYIAAARPDGREIVDRLLDRGADANAREIAGRTPLMAAAGAGNVEAMLALIARKADVNTATASGVTALMEAARNRHPRALEVLLKNGVDVNARTKRNNSALAIAAGYGNYEAVRMLLEHDADIDVRDDRGYSPLMYAAYSESMPVEIVKLLLGKGADVTCVGEGDTALSLAKKRGNTEIARLLENAAALANATELKTAVRKAVGLLAKQSPNFIKRGGCNSCHNQSLPAVAHALARERGVDVGPEIVQMPQEVMEFAVDRVVELSQIGGANTIGYLMMSRLAMKQPADPTTDGWVHYLLATQDQDGRWRSSANRPPLTYDDYFSTAMAVRALQAYAPPGQRTETRRAIVLASAWLLESRPQSTQERTFHLLGLKWTGAARAVIDTAAQALAGEQRKEGGWSQLPAMASDAYATGMALYALNEGGGIPANDPIYQRGVQYLLRTQAQDGSWHVKTRSLPLQPYFDSGFPYGHDQWISAAGTSYAAMALTLAIEPAKGSAVAGLRIGGH